MSFLFNSFLDIINETTESSRLQRYLLFYFCLVKKLINKKEL